MKKSKVMIYTSVELRPILKDYYSDILRDTASEVIEIGGSIVPEIILTKGVMNLSVEDLANVAEPWAQMMMEQHTDCDGIIMNVGNTNFLLTTELEIDMTLPVNPIKDNNLKEYKKKHSLK